MAHFARVENGIVREVNVINNAVLGDTDFPESEPIGQAFIASLGIAGEWKQTSYNTRYVYEHEFDDSEPPEIISTTIVGSEHTLGGTPFRGTYAGIGYIYDAVNDVFVAPTVEEEEPA